VLYHVITLLNFSSVSSPLHHPDFVNSYSLAGSLLTYKTHLLLQQQLDYLEMWVDKLPAAGFLWHSHDADLPKFPESPT
jgi:hypothetical protein